MLQAFGRAASYHFRCFLPAPWGAPTSNNQEAAHKGRLGVVGDKRAVRKRRCCAQQSPLIAVSARRKAVAVTRGSRGSGRRRRLCSASSSHVHCRRRRTTVAYGRLCQKSVRKLSERVVAAARFERASGVSQYAMDDTAQPLCWINTMSPNASTTSVCTIDNCSLFNSSLYKLDGVRPGVGIFLHLKVVGGQANLAQKHVAQLFHFA